MEFALNEEQVMIRESAEAFLAAESDSAAVRRAMELEAGYETSLWDKLSSQMYWHAVHIPQEYGGLGLGYVELVTILEQTGRHLLCAPFAATVCLGVNTLLVAATEDQKAQYLSQIAESGATATLAGIDIGKPAGPPTLTYRLDGDSVLLNGDCCPVLSGHTAELLLVAAKAEGNEDNRVGLFVVSGDAAGLTRQWQPTMDQTRRQARLSFEQVEVAADQILLEPGSDRQKLDDIVDLATIGVAAEQMGGAHAVLERTVDYAGERTQFGRAVGSFQAMKHKAADMMLRAETATSAVYYAACVAQAFLDGEPLGAELAEAASVAKAYCSEAFFINASEAIQMHGGIGFTWEHDAHLYFKRAKSTQHFLGNESLHRERVARLLLDPS